MTGSDFKQREAKHDIPDPHQLQQALQRILRMVTDRIALELVQARAMSHPPRRVSRRRVQKGDRRSR